MEVDRTLGPLHHLGSQRFDLDDLSLLADKWEQYQPGDWTNRLQPLLLAIPAAMEAVLCQFMARHDKALVPLAFCVSLLFSTEMISRDVVCYFRAMAEKELQKKVSAYAFVGEQISLIASDVFAFDW